MRPGPGRCHALAIGARCFTTHRFHKISMKLPIKISLALLPLMALGASDEFRSYDFAKCEIFHISNEPAADRAYQGMVAQADDWEVYQYSGPSGGGRGFCKWSGSVYKDRFGTEFACNHESRSYFPLAGATYSLIRDRGELPSYRCAKGCKKDTPRIIHYVDDEQDGQTNVEHAKTLRQFDRRCRKGA